LLSMGRRTTAQATHMRRQAATTKRSSSSCSVGSSSVERSRSAAELRAAVCAA
jgi:hypothetical protein